MYNENDKEKLELAHENLVSATQKTLSYATSYKDDLSIGDYVRVSNQRLEPDKQRVKSKLSKRTLLPTWSEAIYIITKIIKRSGTGSNTYLNKPIRYRLKEISGLYYRFQLMKTNKPDDTIDEDTKFKDEDEELERETDDDDDNNDKKDDKHDDKPPPLRRSNRIKQLNNNDEESKDDDNKHDKDDEEDKKEDDEKKKKQPLRRSERVRKPVNRLGY